MDPWPHQLRAVSAALAAVRAGHRRVLVTIPTGGGKTLVMQLAATEYLERGEGVTLYSNRRLLVEQLSSVLTAAGASHGVRAAGWESEPEKLFQVASTQTELSRSIKRKGSLHPSGLVLVDEAHLHGGSGAAEIINRHWQAGAAVIGLTATPLSLGHLYDTLVVAGTPSELRACGALVPAFTYGPDEPDLKHIRGIREGEDLSEAQNRKAMMNRTLWGRVWEWFEKLNPEHRPTILFAPGVRESVWFAEQFSARGIPAAHMDGKDVWLDGELLPSTRELREEVIGRSKDGSITVLCNRFVLREGIDLPHLQHGIFATVFGSLQSCLQAGGRLLRAYAGKESVTIQDHGGNWWRHGSLNADREWHLEYTGAMVYGMRADALRAKTLAEPTRCPRCAKILFGPVCELRFGGCGWEFKGKKSRPVVMTDGSLKEMTGDVFRPRRLSRDPEGPKLWERMYFRSRSGKGARTFRAAAALFAYENKWGWPDPSWPLMPTETMDWFRMVEDVPRERLTT